MLIQKKLQNPLLLPRRGIREAAQACVSVLVVVLLVLFLNANRGWFHETGGEKNIKINTSSFTNPSVKNNIDLVVYARQAAKEGWGYVYGTCGQVLSPALLESRQKTYPEEVVPYLNLIEQKWMGRHVTDCAGLIKGYGWLNPKTGAVVYSTNGVPDLSANDLYRAAAETGAINTIPELPGVAVWMNGHIGVYTGGGNVVEAMTTTRGVVTTKLKGRGWSAWLKVPGIQYDVPTQKSGKNISS
jgi:hypothetical protein